MKTSPEYQGQIGWYEATFLAKNLGLIFRKLIMNKKMRICFVLFWGRLLVQLFSPNILS